MIDPHVEALSYFIKHFDRIDYAGAEPLEYQKPTYTVRIAAGRADITMKTHHATADSAREEVEPFLRAWELTAALELGPGQFEFVYHQPKIVDRASTLQPFLVVAVASCAIETINPHIQRLKYPDPPSPDVAVDEAVTKMFERFKRYRFCQTTLGDAANFCLTVLTSKAGGRKCAAARYSIQKKVLDKLGELAANKGGNEARKANGTVADFTATERDWLEKTIHCLIRRAAEIAGDHSTCLPQITMADLPPLP